MCVMTAHLGSHRSLMRRLILSPVEDPKRNPLEALKMQECVWRCFGKLLLSHQSTADTVEPSRAESAWLIHASIIPDVALPR